MVETVEKAKKVAGWLGRLLPGRSFETRVVHLGHGDRLRAPGIVIWGPTTVEFDRKVRVEADGRVNPL